MLTRWGGTCDVVPATLCLITLPPLRFLGPATLSPLSHTLSICPFVVCRSTRTRTDLLHQLECADCVTCPACRLAALHLPATSPASAVAVAMPRRRSFASPQVQRSRHQCAPHQCYLRAPQLWQMSIWWSALCGLCAVLVADVESGRKLHAAAVQLCAVAYMRNHPSCNTSGTVTQITIAHHCPPNTHACAAAV